MQPKHFLLLVYFLNEKLNNSLKCIWFRMELYKQT